MKTTTKEMNLGYFNAVLALTCFIWGTETGEQYQIKCLMNPESTLNVTLDQDPTDVRYVSILKGDTEIAASTGVNDGWNDVLKTEYKDRLILSPGRINITIYLKRVSTTDSGNYTTAVTLKNGHVFENHWNVALRENVKEPKLKDTFKITVTKHNNQYLCTCGEFDELGEPPVEFRWNISNSKVHVLDCPANVSASCTVTWPVSECQDIIYTWTAEHRGEPAADGGSKSGTGRKKRSMDDGCFPANNMSSESTDRATTGYTEVTPVNNDVVAVIVPISVILLIAVIVIVIVTVYCLWRRKICPKRQKDRNRNKRGPETKDEMMEIRKRGSPNFEHEAKDSPDEEKTEMMDQKEKST